MDFVDPVCCVSWLLCWNTTPVIYKIVQMVFIDNLLILLF